MTVAVHADWSVDARKRWMCLAVPGGAGWLLRIEPVGPLDTLLARLRHEAGGDPVALGVDFPIGLPRAYAAGLTGDFPAFLRDAPAQFFEVANTIAEAGPDRPFFPRRGVAGMTRLSLAHALGLDSTAGLSRQCDRATANRPAGAPLFWTLGANQTGKAAISAWLGLLRPALAESHPPALWPFDGPLRALLAPGRVAIAETYPAEAMRQLGLTMGGSKRRHTDRLTLVPALRDVMDRVHATPGPELAELLTDGMGSDAAGEDRLDCLLGVLCVLQVLQGGLDAAPPDPWIARWEGWVLGQAWPAEVFLATSKAGELAKPETFSRTTANTQSNARKKLQQDQPMPNVKSSVAIIDIRCAADADALLEKISRSAEYVHRWVAAQTGEPLDLLRRMKFESVGRHPIAGYALNLVEQINQTWTFTVAIQASRQLMLMHPEAGGFRIAPGAHAYQALDIMSVVDGLVGAETFAAVTPKNNDKLEADLKKLAARPELHRYVFFMSPKYPGTARQLELERHGIQVWSVAV